jgi:hypothetical protein
MKKILLTIAALLALTACDVTQNNVLDNELVQDERVSDEVIYSGDDFEVLKKSQIEALENDFPISLYDNFSDLYYFDSLEQYNMFYVTHTDTVLSLNDAIRIGLFTSEDLVGWGVAEINVTTGNPIYNSVDLKYIYYSEEFRIYKFQSNIATCDFGGSFSQGESRYSLAMQPSSESGTFLFERDGEFIGLQEALNRGYIDIDNFKYYGINRLYRYPLYYTETQLIINDEIILPEIILEIDDED